MSSGNSVASDFFFIVQGVSTLFTSMFGKTFVKLLSPIDQKGHVQEWI